jgi:hypothetical protein
MGKCQNISAEIWENNAEIWEKIIFCRGDMGKYVKNHKRGDLRKYRGDMKFPRRPLCLSCAAAAANEMSCFQWSSAQ